MVLGEAQLGPENAEVTGARKLMLMRNCTIATFERTDRGVLLAGNVESTPVEILVDLDGRIRRGKCLCGHFRQFGIRNGPCRHMIVLRVLGASAPGDHSPQTNGQALVS
jgi:hypothetical protein